MPDPRLDVLAEMYHPRKNTPADVQFTDVAGMSAAAKEKDSKEPISRQTLGFLSGMDALVLVVRAFENPAVPLPEGVSGVDPARDVETVMLEMAFSDLGIIERRLERLKGEIPKMKGVEREQREREHDVLSRIAGALSVPTPKLYSAAGLEHLLAEADPDFEPVLEPYAHALAGLPRRDRQIITSEIRRIVLEETRENGHE